MAKNIYNIGKELFITNDEEIKEGGYVFWEGKIYKYRDFMKMRTPVYTDYFSIILTTDTDLIKDGVQAIDDEFLEWFVKNPSCEFVNIRPFKKFKGENEVEPIYKIIIPKEEPKQTVQEYEQQGLEKHSYELEPKQELLEEAAEIEKIAMDKLKSKWEHLYTFGYPKKPFPTNYENDLNNVKVGLYEGAKWQAERMYSEEDMIDFAMFYYTHQGKATKYWGKDLFKEWFEQFKK
jgi:hypothetical protein